MNQNMPLNAQISDKWLTQSKIKFEKTEIYLL